MRLIRNLKHTKLPQPGCALAIGNFDGLHRGHQAVIAELQKQAQRRGLPSALMVFEPMPLEFLAPAHAPARIASLREKFNQAQNLGLDILVCARFNKQFSQMSAQQFMQLLVTQLRVGYVLVGQDFCFAKNREGNVERLVAFGQQQGFEVAIMPTIKHSEERISSTRVRKALYIGDVEQAKQLLGRAYNICGRVVSGQQLGRTLGFPTANIKMHRRVALCYGVYGVRVQLADGRELYGAANIGVRPAVGGHNCLLEVYLFDFKGDLYGQHINVKFDHFIRPEANFNSLSALTQAIADDVAQIRQLYQLDSHAQK